jgi:hypothetical protein
MRSGFDSSSKTDGFAITSIFRCSLLFLLCALALPARPCVGAEGANRGVWCWATPAPYGLNSIVGNNEAQSATLAQFKSWGISHVYGYYGSQLQTLPGQATLAAWNTILDNNGIESQLLISDNTLGMGDNNIIFEMITFNEQQPPAARFKAVHLDLEPWGLPSWPTDSKYNDLVNLAGEYQQVRSELDTHGESNVLIYADLADWLDTTTINWPSTTVRDQWFSGILTNLAGFTLMAYDESTYSQLVNVCSWELVSHPGVVRIGIDAGQGQTWSNLKGFVSVAQQLESNVTQLAGVDIYDFQTFEEIAPPLLEASAAAPLTTNGFNLMLQGPIGSNYIIQASNDLLNWQDFTNFSSTDWLTYFSDATAIYHPYRFYRVTN